MSDIKIPEVWIIVHKETGEQWTASSGKDSWKAKGHAKNAWINSSYAFKNPAKGKFDNQDEYELKCLFGGKSYVDELLMQIDCLKASQEAIIGDYEKLFEDYKELQYRMKELEK